MKIEMLKLIKMNKTQYLNKTLGGKWRHVPFHGLWVCDDGRHVQYTAPSLDEWDNEIPFSRQCWLYTPGKPTVLFSFH